MLTLVHGVLANSPDDFNFNGEARSVLGLKRISTGILQF
jgi:hypothetical protein